MDLSNNKTAKNLEAAKQDRDQDAVAEFEAQTQ